MKSFLLVALFLFASPALPQILESTEHFRAEDTTVPHPATLPDAALQILLKDAAVHHTLGKSTHINPKWLLVSQLHLSDSTEENYIAIGRGPLAVGNAASFWIFHQRGKSFDLILDLSAHDLILRTTTTRSLRDLEAVSIAANSVTITDYAFDGTRYQPHHPKTEKIK